MSIKWFWMWIGGAITRVAGTGLVIGIFIVAYGATPGQAVADLMAHLPPGATNPWFKLVLVLVGLLIIGLSLHFNVWSLRQRAIDDLAEDVSWAIDHLLNRAVSSQADVSTWQSDYGTWCQRVTEKLGNRAFFTRADQLHFNSLGFVPPANFASSYDQHHEWLVSQLRMKFERLRDVINWTQMRRR